MNRALQEQAPPDRLGTILGIAIRLLLAAVVILGGAWAASTLAGTRGRYGAALGLALIVTALAREKALLGFCRRNASLLIAVGFSLYVVILGLATYSELFDLGWFNWLSP